jgi:hypothetical protein
MIAKSHYEFEGKKLQVKIKIGKNAELVRAKALPGTNCVLVKDKLELWGTYNTPMAAYRIPGVKWIDTDGVGVYNVDTKRFERVVE